VRTPRRVLFVAAFLAVVGTGYQVVGSSEAGTGEPEETTAGVRLEKVIRTKGDLGRGRWLRRLTGRRDPELFDRPYGVVWMGEDLVVTDPGARKVVRIAASGGITMTSADLFRSPIGIATCPSGIVVSDSASGRVGLLDEDLRLRRWIAEDLDRPTGVACRGERIFVVETGRHRVVAFEPVGWIAPIEPRRRSVVEADGLFLIPTADGQEVLVLDEDHIVRILGRRGSAAGEFNFPTTLTLGMGSLWIGDSLNFRLQRFDPDSGEFDGSFGRIGDAAGEMPRLKGLAVDNGDRIWVTDAYLDQIALYEEDGRFLSSLGGHGAGPLEFSFPAGIAAHADGRVAIVDSLNRRLQIVRLAGAPANTGRRGS